MNTNVTANSSANKNDTNINTAEDR